MAINVSPKQFSDPDLVARDAKEAAQSPNGAADWDLSLVDEDEIGAGKGLDEAELAEIDPVEPSALLYMIWASTQH